MSKFLAIKRERLSWATCDEGGVYQPETVTGQWLNYERGLTAKKKRRSEFERVLQM